MPSHLVPARPYAPDALLPGDPGRALLLAQELLESPLMVNHARGLWGYTGEGPDGRPLSIQATGMGGPSAAIVLQELAELGVRRAIRVGTCGGLDPELELGDLLIVEAAIAGDGASQALGADGLVEPDAQLTARLVEAGGGRPAPVATTDLFYEIDPARELAWERFGAVAVEMECATLFALGPRAGVQVACVLAVSDILRPQRRRIEPERLEEAARSMGRAAAGALAGATR